MKKGLEKLEKRVHVLKGRGFHLAETVLYYENRPFPYTEVWVNKEKKWAVLIDHGICEQPVCGATWSYRAYVEKQNTMQVEYICLRYTKRRLAELEQDLDALTGLVKRETQKEIADPRRVHPQLIGESAYEKMLRKHRGYSLCGITLEIVLTL